MKKALSVLVVALFACTAWAAEVPVPDTYDAAGQGAWVKSGFGTNDNYTNLARSARFGPRGADGAGGGGPMFYYNTTIPGSSEGNTYYGWVRFNQSSNGRMYLGVGADAKGAVGVTARLNTSEITLESYDPWGFKPLATAPFTWTVGRWYRIGVEWNVGGTMSAHVWADGAAGSPLGTPLAGTATVASGLGHTSGGYSMRFWSGSATSNYISFDSIPEPASLVLLALGGVLALRRR